MGRNYQQLLQARWKADHLVCIGLDSEYAKLPLFLREKYGAKQGEAVLAFNRSIVDSTFSIAGSYKIQSSFYEAHGEEGIAVLRGTIEYIQKKAPEIPIIVDAKRADIGNTNMGYIEAIFEKWGADAVTLHPYLGGEALKPLLDLKDKGLIILCRTSNPGAGEFQDRKISLSQIELYALTHGPAGEYGSHLELEQPIPLYQYVALRVANHWNVNSNCQLVVGATYPEEASQIRKLVGGLPFLIPGVGAQGGDLGLTVKACRDSQGEGMVISSSRSIIFASNNEDFAEAAAKEAEKLNNLINQFRKES